MSFSKTLLASSMAALLSAGALLSAPAVHASTTIGYIWSVTAYPESLSDNAASDSQGFFCVLCHKTEDGQLYNPYGDAMRGLIGPSSTQDDIVAAFRAIEALNSDADTGGFSNIAEINADAQPGWKESDSVPQNLVGNLLDPILTAPEIAVAPASVDYGAVVIGTKVTGTEITISNSGSADLTVDSLATNNPVFSLGQQTPNTPFTIAAGANQRVGVVYTPDDLGLDTGALTIGSDDTDEPEVAVALSGTGVEATDECVPSVDPTVLAFGQGLVGISLELPVTLTNFGIGSCDVDISVPNCIDGEFLLTSASALALGPGDSSIVTVSYTPINLGQDQCRIDILTQGNDVTVPMSGEGVDALPTDLDIKRFTVSKKVSLSKGGGIITMEIAIQNNGTERGAGTLTVKGQQGSNQFIHQVVKVSDPVGGGATNVKLQAYIPEATGEIKWTATLQDGDPDLDEKVATTNVTK